METLANIQLNTIKEAINDIRKGKIIIVVDDEDRENEGDFIVAAEKATPEIINFMAKYGRGLHCVPLPEERCNELDLHPMVNINTDPKETAFTVSVDLLGYGVTTGISASDRSKTVMALIDPNTKPTDLGRPGHIFPLRAKKGGVLRRPGHTEAAVDLTKLAGLKPGGVIVEIMNEDGTMARLPQLIEIAKKFDLKLISIQDLIAYRLKNDSLIERIDSFPAQTFFGDFELISYKQTTNDQIHFALKKGNWTIDETVPVRVKSTNSYYDLFNALQHGETPLLEATSKIIEQKEKGVIIFINNLTDSELLLTKMNQFKQFLNGKAESGSLPMDNLDYGIGAQIIKDLGIKNINLITRNKDNKRSISGYGLEVVNYTELG